MAFPFLPRCEHPGCDDGMTLRTSKSAPPTAEEVAIAARVQREKALIKAWRNFKAHAPRKVRRRLKSLPPTGIYRHDPD